MTETQETWIKRVGGWSPLMRAVVLAIPFPLLMLVMGPLAWNLDGRVGLVSVGFAAVICLVSAWLALFVTSLVAPPSVPTAHILLGMLIRMGLPLMTCLVVVEGFPGLANARFAIYLIPFFLAGLMLETLLSVARLQPSVKPSAAAPTDFELKRG